MDLCFICFQESGNWKCNVGKLFWASPCWLQSLLSTRDHCHGGNLYGIMTWVITWYFVWCMFIHPFSNSNVDFVKPSVKLSNWWWFNNLYWCNLLLPGPWGIEVNYSHTWLTASSFNSNSICFFFKQTCWKKCICFELSQTMWDIQ